MHLGDGTESNISRPRDGTSLPRSPRACPRTHALRRNCRFEQIPESWRVKLTLPCVCHFRLHPGLVRVINGTATPVRGCRDPLPVAAWESGIRHSGTNKTRSNDPRAWQASPATALSHPRLHRRIAPPSLRPVSWLLLCVILCCCLEGLQGP